MEVVINAKQIISVILAFLMLAGALLVTVSAEDSLYKDVKVKRWSYEDIKYVSEKGLMNGKSEGIFAPAETMTRAMVVTVFYRLAGSPAVEYAATFTDVKANKWFTDAVIRAADNGIVNGTGNGKYEPMANVTREHSVDEPHLTRFSTVENNPVFGIDVNYLFVNPALGDYRIREDAGDGKISKLPYIPFAEMGRQ